MKNEIWRPIKGYDGDYLVSNLGRVKSLRFNKEKILKPYISNHGYYVVGLTKNNIRKTIKIHRLVSEAFIENKDNKLTVNHLDGNKLNNNVTNLEWATYSENTKHAYKTGLCENARKAVKKNVIKAHEVNKKPIYSKKLDMRFESGVDAAKYIQSIYFENSKLWCLQMGISLLLNNQRIKSKYDYGWQYI